MADLGIYNFVQAALARGETEEQITATLIKNGMNQQEITDAFTAVRNKKPPTVSDRPKEIPHGSLLGRLCSFFVFLLIISGAIAGYLEYTGAVELPVNVPMLPHADAACSNADSCVKRDVDQIVVQAKKLHDFNDKSYATLCSGEVVNVTAATGTSATAQHINNVIRNSVHDIMFTRSVSTQQDAGIKCGSSKDRFYVNVSLENPDVRNYCVDSRGVATSSQPNAITSFCGNNLSQI